MKKLNKIFLVLIHSVCNLFAQSYNWPNTPFDQQHWINGTFCENRPSGSIQIDHFHDGVDINLAQGNNVYSVINGTVSGLTRGGLNAYIRVGRYAYVHVEPSPALGIGSPVTAYQTVVGLTNSYNHIHFIDGYNGNEINPLRNGGGLDPFVDTYNPYIDWIKFYINRTTTEFVDGRVSGQVEIVAKARDKTDSGPIGDNNGIYKIGYQIFDAPGSTPLTGELVRFQFDQIPPGSAVTYVYFPGSGLSDYLYTLTNNLGSDGYWDTGSWDPGLYQVRVFTEDTRGNSYERWRSVEIVTQDVWSPAIPVLKSLEGNSNNAWELRWQANDSSDVGGYRLYYSNQGSSWFYQSSISGGISANDTSVTFNAFSNNVTIYFRLAAHDLAAIPNISDSSDAYGVRLSSSGPRILIVDGFDRMDGYWTNPTHTFIVRYGEVLTDMNLSFNSCSNEAVISGEVILTDYEAVIYLLGDESGPTQALSGIEQAKIADYLRSGGRLIISGSNIGYDLVENGSSADSIFYSQFLKANYVANSSGVNEVSGNYGTFMDGLSTSITIPGNGIIESDVVDALEGQIIMTYDNGDPAAIFYEGVFSGGTKNAHLAYFAFPIELIDSKSDRTLLLNQVFEQFYITAPVISGEDVNFPQNFALKNYPNPFNPYTKIKYSIAKTSSVGLSIFNVQGRRVKTLVDEVQAAGEYTLTWDGTDLAGSPVSSGIYIYRLSVNSNSVHQKMMLIR